MMAQARRESVGCVSRSKFTPLSCDLRAKRRRSASDAIARPRAGKFGVSIGSHRRHTDATGARLRRAADAMAQWLAGAGGEGARG